MRHAFLATAFAASLLALQDPRSVPAGRAGASASRPEELDRGDGLLAAWLLVEGQSEVELAQVAEQRAQDPAVKALASAVIEERRAVARALEPFAAAVGYRESGASATAAERQRSGAAEGDPAEGAAREAGSSRTRSIDALPLVQELGREHLDSARTVLKQKDDGSFDRCYLAMAIAGQRRAKDALTVFERHATPDLVPALRDARRAVTEHLRRAEDLERGLEAPADGARAAAGAPEPDAPR